MKKLKITGGKILTGTVNVRGAKNSTLPIIAASIINQGKVTLQNVPNITDVTEMLEILRGLNVKYEFIDTTLIIDSSNIKYSDLLSPSVKKIRASYYFIGSLISCFNKVKIATPGGCSIGSRPIDFHIEVMEQLGATYSFDNDILTMSVQTYNPLNYTFKKKSVGATINALLASVNSNKTIILNNVALEPEVEDVINFLNKMGCNITTSENTYICFPRKNLVTEIHHKIIPDRIEAATYITLGLLTGDVKVCNINSKHLDHFLKPLKKSGANLEIYNDYVVAKKSRIQAFDITTGEYPKFSTDIQPIVIVLLSLSNGDGMVQDNIFKDRFKSCIMLNKMGADIQIFGEQITFSGVDNLKGAKVDATDLRASAALLLASLTASGITTINNIEHINRGYCNIFENVSRLGAAIELENQ